MEKKRVICIIQAHMSSTRLPGKIMKDLCGEPALYRMIERLRQCKLLDDIVIATSTKECDDIIVEHCDKWGVHWFRGSDSDVLSRYWGAAQEYPSEYVVRATSDCPLITPVFMDEIIQFMLDHDYRYVNGVNGPAGIGGEIFTRELLQEAAENSTEGYEHEHVSPYMFMKQDSVAEVPYFGDYSHYRITLDTEEDYQAICAVYEGLYQPGNTFGDHDIINFLDTHPEVVAINAMIQQKPWLV